MEERARDSGRTVPAHPAPRTGPAPRPDPAEAVLALQRAAGNRAVALAVQRRSGAVPIGYMVANGPVDNATATVVSHSTWASSTGNLGDLDDVQTREVIDFGEDPRVKVPGYGILLAMDPKFQLAGNVLTKGPDTMQAGSADDTHSGAGYGTSFTRNNGVANLLAGAWVLTGTQHYEYRTAGGPWLPLHAGTYAITRTMARQGDHYELTQTKAGPGVNLTAGPATIGFETRSAMAALTTARPNQDADWASDLAKLNRAGLVPVVMGMATKPAGTAGHSVSVSYFEFQPNGPVDPTLRGPGGTPFVRPGRVDPNELATLFAQAKIAVDVVIAKALGAGGHAPPASIEFYFYPEGAGSVRQQSYFTSAGGGTYRVLLKGRDSLAAGGQKGALAGNLKTSIPGQVAGGGWSSAGKLERFCKATAAHELGHMMHALNDPDVYLQATIMPGSANPIQPASPLYPESVHVATVNDNVMTAYKAALGTKNARWRYSRDNPAEVVAEAFTAMVSGKSILRAVAAVYVAYGGPRSAAIDQRLAKVFPGGTIPAIAQPEGAPSHM